MSLLDLIFGRKKPTASIAKERLQIILAHERATLNEDESKPDWLNSLQKELIEVIAKYVKINKEDLTVNLERRDNLELLEINIALPENKEEQDATS